MVKTINEIIQRAKALPTRKIAIAGEESEAVLKSADDALREDIADPILIGNREKIYEVAQKANVGLGAFSIVDAKDEVETARIAVELVSKGNAEVVVKGIVKTPVIMKAILDKEAGLRTDRLLTHVFLIEIEGFDRLLIVTDGGIIISPTLEEKIHIVQNAIDFALAIGIEEPKVALLGAIELVNPKMPESIEAAAISKMAERGQIKGGIVDGPLALDNAISEKSAKIKGIKSPIAGKADILVVPDIRSGNIFGKSLMYFSKIKSAALVVGAKAPIVLTSRSDSAENRLNSIAIGIIMAESMKRS